MKKTRREKAKTLLINKQRLAFVFAAFALLIFLLIWRVAYIQFIDGDKYKKLAIQQQTDVEMIRPHRGKIKDKHGRPLAITTKAYSIWVDTNLIKRGDKTQKQIDKEISDTAKKLAKILKTKPSKIKKILNSDTRVVKIAKHQDWQTADKIRKAGIPGLKIGEDTKRYYPRKNFLGQTLGSVTDEEKGLSGLEMLYNRELGGVAGRWEKNTDTRGNPLLKGGEKYYEPVDGHDIILTIDEVVQRYAEESVSETLNKTGAKKVSTIVMNPKNGQILAMATAPGFDPNHPRRPAEKWRRKEFNKLSSKKKMDYLNNMWRNPLISDIYEPGSTAKLVTVAASLEEGIVNRKSTFYCSGYLKIMGEKIKCWRHENPHGSQDLYSAVGNSCNPAMMTMALNLGIKKYYEYIRLFGLTEKTDIDFPGEASPIVVPEKKATKLDLAIMGFGQTNAVSAIQLITAVSALGNDGFLMQPYLVKEIQDRKGKTLLKNKPKKLRQAVSKQTAKEMCHLMEYIVEKRGARTAYLKGYRIGGKTGTAQKISDKGGYSDDVIASFIGMAPMNNPQIAVLYIIDSPPGREHGAAMAAPQSKRMIKKILDYQEVEESVGN